MYVVCLTCSSCDFSWLTKSLSCLRCLDRSSRSARTDGELLLALPPGPLRFLREDMMMSCVQFKPLRLVIFTTLQLILVLLDLSNSCKTIGILQISRIWPVPGPVGHAKYAHFNTVCHFLRSGTTRGKRPRPVSTHSTLLITLQSTLLEFRRKL